MTKKESFSLTAKLTGIISSANPVYDFSEEELAQAELSYTEHEIAALEKMGWLQGDFELFLVISGFLSKNRVFDIADDNYITEVFRNARKLSAADFYKDEYIKNVAFNEVREGNFLLTSATYERGELLLYDAPDFSKDIVVPKIAFFTEKVTFPTLYEGGIPWMSVCPSEINSMEKQMKAAHGDVLVLGCGLGYYQFMVSAKNDVNSVTIVEISDEIADIFREHLLPCFPQKEKIRVIRADAIDYMSKVKKNEYDFVFADIWEGILDGAPLYEKIKAHEKRLPDTEFSYWIGDQIEYYLKND